MGVAKREAAGVGKGDLTWTGGGGGIAKGELQCGGEAESLEVQVQQVRITVGGWDWGNCQEVFGQRDTEDRTVGASGPLSETWECGARDLGPCL